MVYGNTYGKIMRSPSPSRDPVVADQSPASDVIRGKLAVELDPAAHCETLTDPTAAEVLRQEIRPRPGPDKGHDTLAECGECHTELRHTDNGQPRYEYRIAGLRPGCICPALLTDDCLARLETITDGTVTVRVTATGGEAFRELIGALEQRAPSVTVEWVLWNGESESDRPTTNDLTRRQREAVETALSIGYYERPRTATLEDLAKRLEITKSAASQRLNAAETKLVKSAFEP